MVGLLDHIYKRLPVFAQNVAVSAYGVYWNRLRFGGQFRTEMRGFVERENWMQNQWQTYQEKQLRELLITAFTRVPYYRDAWNGIVSRKDLETFQLSDLPSLPPLDKSIARDHPFDLLVDGKPHEDHLKFYTSGSSGTPVTTFWKPHELQRSLALREVRSCRPARVSYQFPRATFSGRMVEPNPNSKGPFHRFNSIEKQVYFSAFHLKPTNVSQYIEALRQHKIRWLTGYSNSIYQLAIMAREKEANIPKLDAVITTSEKLTDDMRRCIENVFQTEVYEEYGTVEDLFYVAENEYHQKLISPDAGILEVVDEKFHPLPLGHIGEVLATGFIRKSQIMIRYRIGDLAIISHEESKCGRHMPVLAEVIGRQEDTIYAPDGRRMVRFHGIFVNQPSIQEAQVIQEKLNLIRVKVVPNEHFTNSDTQDIVERVQQRLTKDMNVVVEITNQIPRNKSGKFPAVVSKLDPEEIKRITT